MPRKRREIPWLELRDETYCVYWHGDGRIRRLSLGTQDRVEAQKRYAGFLAGGQQELDAKPGGPPSLTVAQALDDYYREHVTLKVIDKERAEDCIENLNAWFRQLDHWRIFLGDLNPKESAPGDEIRKWFKTSTLSNNPPLSDVDIPATRAYAEVRRLGIIGGGKRRSNACASDSTIRRELVVLQAAANHEVEWKRIGPKATPITGMPSIELPQEAPQQEIWLTQTELALAISRATGRLRAFIEVAYYTAARRASVERLTKFQVDLAQGRITLTSPHEDANQRRSKKRRPVVPIDPKLRPTIERLMLETPNEWLFGDTASMYRPFVQHLEALGLPDKAFPHILRHSRATHLLQAGVSLWDVSALLGDTVATVQRVYGHHSADFLAQALARPS